LLEGQKTRTKVEEMVNKNQIGFQGQLWPQTQHFQ